MLKNELEIVQENRVLEGKVKELEIILQNNKKEEKYLIGLTVAKNLHPRSKIFSVPKELRKLKSNMKDGVHHKAFSKEPYAYNKELKEYYNTLQFYNDKEKSDLKYAVGEEIYKAQHNVGAFVCLPFRLLKLRKNYRSLVYGKKKNKETVALPPIEGLKESILFVATNGAGLGHLTRCLAVARRLQRLRPDAEIVFLTTSLALTTIRREGFTAYCIPSLMLIKNMSSAQWNALLRNMLSELLQLYKFSAVIFDGAMPFASATALLADEQHIPKIWIRRGSEKSSDWADKRNEAEAHFDYIILPGEAAEKRKAKDDKHLVVEPIIYLERDELWSREAVRKYLKISEDKIVVYIQLGAGNINDIDSDINKVIVELRKYPNVIMVLGESIIGNELKIIEDDIIVIKDYPNSKYFGGFDFAISACGYNSFHELLYFGVPTIFLPNMNTETDDQYARAIISQNNNAGIVVTQLDDEQLVKAIEKMCDSTLNKAMRENATGIINNNGANVAAQMISDIIDKSLSKDSD